jgi:hypothetical protein
MNMDQKKFTCSESEYHQHVNDYDGICLKCGEWKFGSVEPDAEGYACEEEDCRALAVMGAENAMIGGHLEITNDE